ncbi:MAG TPA: hypothetical protein VL177_14265 [Terriglobales bacterium]|jgi:hypothetical protein|nr:hypothetical protein [Terriglobales bacterium]
MRRLALLLVALLFALLLPLAAEISGTFRGVIVHAPAGEPTQGWIYVAGRNGNLRRAEVSHAQVLYAGSVPVRLRAKDPFRSLKEGAEVRVTASQDGKGEWQASRVEILKVRESHHRKRPQLRPAADRPTGLNSAP